MSDGQQQREARHVFTLPAWSNLRAWMIRADVEQAVRARKRLGALVGAHRPENVADW